jgi:hypothetical protein
VEKIKKIIFFSFAALSEQDKQAYVSKLLAGTANASADDFNALKAELEVGATGRSLNFFLIFSVARCN